MRDLSRQHAPRSRTHRVRAKVVSTEDLRRALVRHGAPLLEYGPAASSRRLTLEATLVNALRAARHDGLLFRVLPVVVAKNRSHFDFPKLAELARRNAVSRELGLLLELTGKLVNDPHLVRCARMLGLPASRRPVRALLVRNRYERQLAEMRATETTKRWKIVMNVSEEGLRELLNKHGLEAAVV